MKIRGRKKKKIFIAADVGNTRASLALFHDLRLVKRTDLSEKELTQRVVADCVKKWSSAYKYDITEAVISDVNKKLGKKLISIFKKIKVRSILLKSLVKKDVFEKYASFSKLGDDRVANTYYIKYFVFNAAVIADIGTTINIDVFDGKRYLGGYIISGHQLELSAIHQNAGGTIIKEKVLFSSCSIRPGLCTKECLERGIELSKKAFVSAAVNEVKKTLKKKKLKVILTGGGSKVLKGSKIFDIVDVNATLKGVAAAYAMGQKTGVRSQNTEVRGKK